MAEMLVRVFDKYRGPEWDLVQLQKRRRGHIVVVVPDGWEWSWIERQSHDWIIIRCPELSVDQLQAKASVDLDRLTSRGYRIASDFESRTRRYLHGDVHDVRISKRDIEAIQITKDEFLGASA